MRFKIHFEWPDGTEDCVGVEGDTIEQVRERAVAEVAKRGGLDPWSEEIKED